MAFWLASGWLSGCFLAGLAGFLAGLAWLLAGFLAGLAGFWLSKKEAWLAFWLAYGWLSGWFGLASLAFWLVWLGLANLDLFF